MQYLVYLFLDFLRDLIILILGVPISIVLLTIGYVQEGKHAFRFTRIFHRLESAPLGLGASLVTKVVGLVNPYGASISPTIVTWSSSAVVMRMNDRPWFVVPPLLFTFELIWFD